jgi:hypothetical protein
MTRFVVGEDRSQSTLFAERLEDYLSEDNPVRAIDIFVDELDLAKLTLFACSRLRVAEQSPDQRRHHIADLAGPRRLGQISNPSLTIGGTTPRSNTSAAAARCVCKINPYFLSGQPLFSVVLVPLQPTR